MDQTVATCLATSHKSFLQIVPRYQLDKIGSKKPGWLHAFARFQAVWHYWRRHRRSIHHHRVASSNCLDVSSSLKLGRYAELGDKLLPAALSDHFPGRHRAAILNNLSLMGRLDREQLSDGTGTGR